MYGLRAVATVAASERAAASRTDCGAAALSSTCECKKSNLPVILHNARTHAREYSTRNRQLSPLRIVLHNSRHKLQAVLDFFTGQRTHSPSVRLSVRPTVGRLVLLLLLTFGVGRSVCDGGSRRLTALLAASVRLQSLCVCCCFCSVSFRPPVAMRRPPLPSLSVPCRVPIVV